MRVSEEKKAFSLSLSFLAWSDCIRPLCLSKLGHCIVLREGNNSPSTMYSDRWPEEAYAHLAGDINVQILS